MTAAARSTKRVLIIDDNVAIHDDFKKVLASSQSRDSELDAMEAMLFETDVDTSADVEFVIDTATQGAEGFDRVKAALAAGNPYALAFVDIRMPPGWDGVETIERLWQVDPQLQVVICSAYSDYTGDDIRKRLANSDSLLLLRKPFDPTEVKQIAHAMTSKWDLHQAERERAERLEAEVQIRTTELSEANARLAEEMARRAQMEAELRLSQKLEAIGQLAAGIAHEINTPVQYVNDNVHFLRNAFGHIVELGDRLRAMCEGAVAAPVTRAALDELAAFEDDIDVAFLRERVPRAFDASTEGIKRIASIVQAMKEFGHQDNGIKSQVDLNRALATTLEVTHNVYKYVADVETDLGELPAVTCLGGELNQVFVNLIVNAAHAIGDKVGETGDRGTITLRSRCDGDAVVISIGDSGTGIPETVQQRVFDPFFTTKEVGKGTGQGLAIARSIVVDKHGGRLWFDTTPGVGTTFHVALPIEDLAVSP
jgi:signal transduction histidine kinase